MVLGFDVGWLCLLSFGDCWVSVFGWLPLCDWFVLVVWLFVVMLMWVTVLALGVFNSVGLRVL